MIKTLFVIYILQANNSPSISDWAAIIQVALAIGTIFLAIITYFQGIRTDLQGKKIQDLTNIVSELQNQNIILEKRFQIEKMISIMDRMPFFKLDHYDKEVREGIGYITIHLNNVGLGVSDLKIFKNKFYTFTFTF